MAIDSPSAQRSIDRLLGEYSQQPVPTWMACMTTGTEVCQSLVTNEIIGEIWLKNLRNTCPIWATHQQLFTLSYKSSTVWVMSYPFQITTYYSALLKVSIAHASSNSILGRKTYYFYFYFIAITLSLWS